MTDLASLAAGRGRREAGRPEAPCRGDRPIARPFDRPPGHPDELMAEQTD